MKNLGVIGVLVFAVMLFVGVVFGAEVPVPVSEGAPEVDKPSVFSFLIALETTWKILGMLGTVLITWVFKLIGSKIAKQEADKEVVDVIQQAVISTYTELVQGLKRSASDGKLTSSDIKLARELAYNKSIAIASGPAKALLVAWGKDKAMSVIELIVNKLKGKKNKGSGDEAPESSE